MHQTYSLLVHSRGSRFISFTQLKKCHIRAVVVSSDKIDENFQIFKILVIKFDNHYDLFQAKLNSRAGNLLIGFPSESLVFGQKMSDSLIFGEQPEQFAHDCSFPLSNLSESLMVAHFW